MPAAADQENHAGNGQVADSKKRGVIIVDTGALVELWSEIPEMPGKRYLEILNFLADHGYKILILDAVAHENAEVLPSGAHLRRYFDQPSLSPGRISHRQCTEFIQAACETDPAKKAHPNISLVRSDSASDIGQMLNELQEIVDAFPPDTPKNCKEARRRIAAIHKRKKQEEGARNGGHKGNRVDDAFVDFVNQLSPEEKQGQVFLLSTDHRLMNRATKDDANRNICQLNVRGLLDALTDNNLHTAMGFRPHCTTEEIYQYILYDMGTPPNSHITYTQRGLPESIDARGHERGTEQKPFSKALRTLSEALGVSSPPVAPDYWLPPGYSERVKRGPSSREQTR